MRYRITKKLGKIRIDDYDILIAIGETVICKAIKMDMGGLSIHEGDAKAVIKDLKATGKYNAMIDEIKSIIKAHPLDLHHDGLVMDCIASHCQLMLSYQMQKNKITDFWKEITK